MAAPARRTSPASRRAPTCGPTAVRRADRRHQRAHASPCCTTPRRRPSGPRCDSLGKGTTLLVDTYDIAEAVRLGVEIAGPELGAVRIDSGDLGVPRPPGAGPARRARRDRAPGSSSPPTSTSSRSPRSPPRRSTGTASAPQLVTGSGHPTCGFVYKLVAREDDDGEMVSVAKKSKDKISIGGRKYALRRRDPAGRRRGRGHRHRHARRSTTATTARCWCRWSGTARSSAASRSTTAASPAPALPGRAADRGAADVAGRAGHRDPPPGRPSGRPVARALRDGVPHR